MKISSTNNINFAANEKKNNGLKNSAIIASTTAIGVGVGFVKTKTIDLKNLDKNCKKSYDAFVKNVEDSADRAVNAHAKMYPNEAPIDLDAARMEIAKLRIEKYEQELNRLNKNFPMVKKRSIVFSTAAGLGIGLIGVLTATIIRNKQNKNTKQTPIATANQPNQIIQPSPFNKFKPSVSFKGANPEVTTINGNDYYKADVELAKTFLKYKIKDINIDTSDHLFNDLTNEEYQQEMAKKKLLTEKPSEPFWGTWSSKWDQYEKDLEKYNEGCRQYKVVCELLKFLRRSEKLEEAKKVEQEFIKNYSIANTKDILVNKFIQFINNETAEEKTIPPNAIMLEGENKKINEDIIIWLAQKTNTDFKIIDNEEDDDRKCLSKIQTILEKSKNTYELNGGRRTILYVANFDKLLIPSEDNNDVIGDLKDLLGNLEEDYKTTLVFETQNSIPGADFF